MTIATDNLIPRAPYERSGPKSSKVVDVVVAVLCGHEQPSAWDLVNIVERELGWKARWCLKEAINELRQAPASKKAWRGYLDSLRESGDLDAALYFADCMTMLGISAPDEIISERATGCAAANHAHLSRSRRCSTTGR